MTEFHEDGAGPRPTQRDGRWRRPAGSCPDPPFQRPGHGAFFAAMSNATALATALRRLIRADRAAAFAGALGLEPCGRALPRGEWATLGLELLTGLRSVVVAAAGAGVEALYLGFDEEAEPAGVARAAKAVRLADVAAHRLFICGGGRHRRLIVACFGLEGELRHLTVDRLQPRASDLETLAELTAAPGEGATALALRHARALDRSRITRQFFDDFRARRAAVSHAWTGATHATDAERDQLALLFLCRLMFLYFLQHRGHLAGDHGYLPALLARWRRQQQRTDREPKPRRGTFFRNVCAPLFFGALNTRPEDREPAARALGPLPYLNGGLFERHPLERRFPRLDLPDHALGEVFDALLERYRFTTREPSADALDGAQAVGVDPEMLGRVFEGLMAADRRGATGTFYTPSPVVTRIAADALTAHLGGGDTVAAAVRSGDLADLDERERERLDRALRDLTLLDPACGSGAFLLGALSLVSRLRATLNVTEPVALRRDFVGRGLYGVDVQEDAALLCALRLWLALAVEADRSAGTIPPLPNLDRHIRQGDALLDPLELGGPTSTGGADQRAAMDPPVRQALRELAPLGASYLTAGPGEREPLRRAIARTERNLARAWTAGLHRRLARRVAELEAASADRDLFGEETAGARRARAELPAARGRRAELAGLGEALTERRALPFFSFQVHFAEAASAGFDMVLSNPPWVRAHRWPASIGRLVRQRYGVCRSGGWRRGASLGGAPAGAGGQVDLSLLFLERALGLLAAGGTLGMLLPAKAFRSLYAAPARRMMLRETRVVSIEDHGLDQRSIFRADAFAAAIIARKRPAAGSDVVAGAPLAMPEPPVRVTLIRRRTGSLVFHVPQEDLPLVAGDPDAPWLLAPPATRDALRRMQTAGPPLGEHEGLRVRRGIFTGANAALLITDVRPKIGDLARIRAEGWSRGGGGSPVSSFDALVEASALRPLVRGADVSAWTYRTPCHVIWLHGEDGKPRPAPRRMAAYLAKHSAILDRDGGASHVRGRLHRVRPAALGAKVAWHDLAPTLNAVAIPARTRSVFGTDLPVVPLNTVYFIPTADHDRALLLTAYLNSLPVRTFARAIAERAKDARFRFFAWTIAILPLPEGWDRGDRATRLSAIAQQAHTDGGLDARSQDLLDTDIARAYRLEAPQLDALRTFDAWLRGCDDVETEPLAEEVSREPTR
jgi:hypothetical protein